MVYCDLERRWFKHDSGSVSKHARANSHKALTADVQAHPDGWLEGEGQRRRYWRWAGDPRSKELGKADDSVVDCTEVSSEMSAGPEGLPDGQSAMTQFTFPSLKDKDRRQLVINAQAAHIVLDNRPLTSVLRRGYRTLTAALRPNYVVASVATTARTIIAQRNFLAQRLQQLIQ